MSASTEPASQIEWQADAPRKRPGEEFVKNMAVASALVLFAVTLRTGAIPPLNGAADAIMTAASDDSLLDDQLGKLSFVSTLFPEAVLVFGEQSGHEYSLPVSAGTVVHAWSAAEPYMSWTASGAVTASASGEVVGVYHGNGDEKLVEVMGYDGISCVYGNLGEIAVSAGDAIESGDTIGTLLAGKDFVLEIRRGGRSVDPMLYLQK